MIIDSSALIAILHYEHDWRVYAKAIKGATHRRISAANFLETAILIDGTGDPIASRRFDDLLIEANIAVTPVTEAQVRIARCAYRDFGKSSRHPAKLNFGDCLAYALSKESREPLLFKGKDFSKTDVRSALD